MAPLSLFSSLYMFVRWTDNKDTRFSSVDGQFNSTYAEFWLQRPQLVKGHMQLFSVEQQRSQALEAHAASFATFKV